MLPAALLAGCAPPIRDSRIVLESLRNPEHPQPYNEVFDEAIYATDGRGRWDIVLFKSRPAATDAAQTMEQWVHMRLFWRAVPGTTYAESSQTNAVLVYCLASGASAIGYEGAGFVYMDVSARTGLMTGRIESSGLSPARRSEGARDQFGPCRLTGRFRALRDDARVAEMLGRITERLGPPPRVDPHAGTSDVR